MSPEITPRIARSPLTQFTYHFLSWARSGSEIQGLFSVLSLLDSLWSPYGHVTVFLRHRWPLMIQICPMSAVRQFCSPFAARAPLQSHACDQQVPLCLQHTLASWPGQSNQKSPENKGKCSMKSSRELITCESTKYNGNRGYSTVMEIMRQFRHQAVSRILMLPSVHPVAPQQRSATLLLPRKHSQPFLLSLQKHVKTNLSHGQNLPSVEKATERQWDLWDAVYRSLHSPETVCRASFVVGDCMSLQESQQVHSAVCLTSGGFLVGSGVWEVPDNQASCHI